MDDDFAFGLELIIDGLTQTLALSPQRKAKLRNG
jgi:hypothetical protein